MLNPDVAFGVHPTLGIVAAVSDGLPQAEAALRAAGFNHHKDLDIFVLPRSADRRGTVQLIRDLQTVGYTVAADLQFQRLPSVPDVSSLTTRIIEAQRPSDIARVFDDLLDDRSGVLPALHQLLEAAAEWCDQRLGDDGGASPATSCRRLARQISGLSTDLGFTGGDLLDVDSSLATPPKGIAPFDQASRASAAGAASPARLGADASATAEGAVSHCPPQDPSSQHTRSR